MINLKEVYEIRDVLSNEVIDKIEDTLGEIWYEAFKPLSISGVPPLVIKTNGKDLTNYEIYGNSVQDGTPTLDMPIEVESVGEKTKNLINWDFLLDNTYITKVDNGYYSENYGIIFDTSSNIVKQLKSVLKPGATYTLSRICDKTKDGATIGNIIINVSDNRFVSTGYWAGLKSVTFTPTQEQIDNITTLLIYFNTGGEGATLSEIQLTESDAVLPYEPYGYKIPVKVSGEDVETVTTSIYLDEPLRAVGDYKDYIDFENGSVIRNVAEYTFTGDEIWANRSSSLNVSGKSRFSLSNILNQYPKGFDIKALSNFSIVNTISGAIADTDFGIQLYNSSHTIVYFTTEEMTINDFKTWLKDNNIKIVYQLETPDDTETINLPAIPTHKGTTIIEVDTTIKPSNVEVEYFGKE